MTPDKRYASAVLCGMFFLSGASALIFETLWFRLAGLTFGNSMWASAIVLSSFMGGLALGNGLVAYGGYRVMHPVRAYAAVEVVAGISGAALVLVFPQLTEMLKPLFRPFIELPWVINPLRLIASFLLFVVPATVMGTTLPLLVKALHDDPSEYGRVLGRLYGWNTLGAVAGTLLTELLLVETFGMGGTGVLAGALNVVAAAGALLLRSKLTRPAAHPLEQTAGALRLSRLSARCRGLLAAGCLSGALILALEVVWFRFLVLFLDAVSLAFAVMLSVVLAGIGIGAILASFWYRHNPEAHRYLFPLALVSGISVILAYRAFDFILPGSGDLVLPLHRTCYLSIPLMLPLSLLSGMLFTVIGGAVYKEIGSTLEATGILTMFNTFGAMLGSLVAGFVLLSHVGMETSLLSLSVAYGVVALCCLEGANPLSSRAPRYAGYGLAGFVLVCMACFPFGSVQQHIIDVGRSLYRGDSGWKPVRIQEGLTETSQYWQKPVGGKPLYTQLFTNSFSMSSNCFRARRYMKLFVYWPVAVHPEPRDALLICYGVGSTAKALTDTKELRSITIVDISPDILEGSKTVFSDSGGDPLQDPRVTVHVEDGRFFLQTTDAKFDIVTGEPPPPLMAGVVNLYSQEYFQLIHGCLREGGIVTYWLPVSQIPWAGLKSILKAFSNVFPDCSLWTGNGFDWMLVGSRNAQGPVPLERFSRQWRDPLVSQELRSCGFELPELIGSTFLMDSEHIGKWIEEADPVVDNFPKRISAAGEGHYQYHIVELEDLMIPEVAKKRFEESRFIGRLWPSPLRETTLPYFRAQGWVNQVLCRGGPFGLSATMECIHETLSKSELRTPIVLMTGGPKYPDVEQVMGLSSAASSHRDPQWRAYPGVTALADRDFVAALAHFDSGTNAGSTPQFPFYRVYVACLLGRYEEAKRTIREHQTLFSQEKHAAFLDWLGTTFDLPSSFRSR